MSETVKDIVAEWLRDHGYDGLYFDDCGCPLRDLMPCDCPNPNCAPAREYVCACGDHWVGWSGSKTTDCPVCRSDDDGNQT